MRNMLFMLGLCLALALSIAGCNEDRASSDGSQGASSQVKAARTDAEVDKWNVYVALVNEEDTVDVFKRLDHYFAVFGESEFEKTENTSGYDRFQYIKLEKLNGLADKCLQLSSARKDSLDEAMNDHAAKLLALSRPMEEMAKYYTVKGYVDDDYARGRELHALIVAAIDPYGDTLDALSKAMDAKDASNMQEALQEAEKTGHKITAAFIRFMNVADEVDAEFERQEIPDGPSDRKLDVSAYRVPYDKLAALAKELEGYMSDEKLLKKGGFNEHSRKFFIEYVQNTKAAAATAIEYADAPDPKGHKSAKAAYKSFSHHISQLPRAFNTFLK